MSHKPVKVSESAESQPELEAAQKADLVLLRAEINEVDDALLEYLNKRAALALRFGALKKQAGQPLPVHQPAREEEVIRRLEVLNGQFGGVLPQKDIRRVWNVFFEVSRDLQEG